jgi:hypothetical protein
VTASEILRIKAAVRARDGFACTKCGATNDAHKALTGRQLEVHRITPGSAYGAAPGVCVTLCRSCHGPEPKSPRGTYPKGIPFDSVVMYQLRFTYRTLKYRRKLPPGTSFNAYLNSVLAPLVQRDYVRVMDQMMFACPSSG